MKLTKNKKGSAVGAILTGLIFTLLFAVLIFEGANDVNEQYSEQITNTTYMQALDGQTQDDAEVFSVELSDTAPGGTGQIPDITGGEDVEKGVKGTLAKIFTAPTLVKDILISDTNQTGSGIGSKLQIDHRITNALYIVFALTIALILIRAFIKNPI